MPIVEPGLIPDIKMKYFNPQSLILHFPINMRFSPIMYLFRLTSKLVFLTELILVHMQLVTKMIQITNIIMKLHMKINLNTTL